ncbi:membrane-anchored junction protein [Monodelphis domestica]|uniref:membrane-anchored junction protein n=1 Tax=Monodelphis domestica TaxID=13616 RepID=UPI0024E242FE|nr:membrane-anchored junction protein [Monodelphis domestica]
MSLKDFTYPVPETRFLHAGTNVYKFKIRYGSSIRGEEIADKKVVSLELEDSIRAVLGNLDHLQPFTTEHFIIFPYKSKWERVSHLRFKHGAALLDPYPFVCTLYVEMKWVPAGTPRGGHELPRAGTHEEAEVGAVAVKRRRLEGGNFPSGQERGRAVMGASSRKKPPTRTRRNQPGEAALEAEGSDAALQDPGALEESGSTPADPKVRPPQPSSPPPPEEPPKQGHTGFFGFLSSIFPFSLFSRRGSQ